LGFDGAQLQRANAPVMPSSRARTGVRPARAILGKLGRFPLQMNRTALRLFDLSHFLSENRCPLFRKML
jgi:hypothetical protein